MQHLQIRRHYAFFGDGGHHDRPDVGAFAPSLLGHGPRRCGPNGGSAMWRSSEVTPLIFVFYGSPFPGSTSGHPRICFLSCRPVRDERSFLVKNVRHSVARSVGVFDFPAIVLGVCRFGLMGMAATVLVMFATALKGTVAGHGPFRFPE